MTGEIGAAELVDRLVSIGVEGREARLFVHLVLQGPTRASDAAAAVRLKRTETYRALESLMKRGFVTAHLTRPVVYEAVAPETLFNELLAGHEQRRNELETLRERVAAAAASARDKRISSASRYGYKIIQGRRAILSALEPMVRNARHSAHIASSTFSVHNVTPQNRAYQMMLKRAPEGLPIKILVRESPGLEAAMQPILSHRNVQLRYLHVDAPLRSLVVDGREVVHWLVSDPTPGIEGRDDVAIWTNAPDFVKVQEALFDTFWHGARESARIMR